MARLGLGDGWTCLFANDVDAGKAASYAANFGSNELIVRDVADLTVDDLPHAPGGGPVDLVWASPPCQDVSLAGKLAGLDGRRSGAFWPWVRLMQNLVDARRAPQMIVVENVEGLARARKGADIYFAREALVELGYHVIDGRFDALAFLPQSRPRVFLVGSRTPWGRSRTPWGRFVLPEPLPSPDRPSLASMIDLSAPCNPPAKTARLLASMTETNRAKIAEAQARGGLQVGCAYRRTRPGGPTWEVRLDGIAGCVRTAGGGSSRQTLVLVDGPDVRSRLMSPRECARLMGLPDSYTLPEIATDAFELVGDGVAPPVVRWLAATVLEPLLESLAVALEG
jgi:DNA (cytosine-5)-methyltransferase 1